MSMIPLHPTRALDPHLTYCPRCGGDTDEITVGHLWKVKTSKGWLYFNRGELRKALVSAGFNAHAYNLTDAIDVKENERVPSPTLCNNCQKEMVEFKKEVEAGGVYFRCTKCLTHGVIKAGTTMAVAVREAHGIPAPGECGIEFDDCTQHGGPANGD